MERVIAQFQIFMYFLSQADVARVHVGKVIRSAYMQLAWANKQTPGWGAGRSV